MIGVTIAANRIERDDDLRLQSSNVRSNFVRDLIHRRVDERVGMRIVGRARHPRIAIAKKFDRLQTQDACRALQFVCPHFGNRCKTFAVRRRFADLTARRADEMRADTLPRVMRERSACR